MKKIFTLLLICMIISASAQTIVITPFATGLSSPVDIENAGDDRLFIVQQGGAIKIANADGTVLPNNFLTLTTATISTGGERGLLGLAFHPNYATNGYFYVNYTNTNGDTVVARYTVDGVNPNMANPSSAVIIITVAQPYSNHNGGTIKFGPDGYLYIGMGDGGSAGDPENRAQNINENLGKLLRLDVDSASPYAIPANNPFVGVAGNDEIWATGLRNPWKFSFSRNSGDLWIADVGQGSVEEINHVPSDIPGLNYGWKCYEGNNVYSSCTAPGDPFTFPVAFYTHSGGACSITGGYEYSGSMYPNFQNKYFFADYCINRIGFVDLTTNNITYSTLFSGNNSFTSFGEDLNGELYVAASNTVFKISDSSLARNAFGKMAFSVSPNPATSEVLVKFTNANLPAAIKIYDIAGKLLLNQNVDATSTVISTNSLQSGMYIVKAEDNAGAISSSKLTIR